VVGPSFAATEVADVLEAILDVYRQARQAGETFVQTLRRAGHEPFKAAANSARQATARAEA
jgi:sulfite reductase (NADPH) hemoprotein beta-component